MAQAGTSPICAHELSQREDPRKLQVVGHLSPRASAGYLGDSCWELPAISARGVGRVAVVGAASPLLIAAWKGTPGTQPPGLPGAHPGPPFPQPEAGCEVSSACKPRRAHPGSAWASPRGRILLQDGLWLFIHRLPTSPSSPSSPAAAAGAAWSLSGPRCTSCTFAFSGPGGAAPPTPRGSPEHLKPLRPSATSRSPPLGDVLLVSVTAGCLETLLR